MGIRSYRDLLAWQKAMDLAEQVYRVTRAQEWPREELYGLTAQVRRATASVPSNIAEGHGRIGAKEYLHHLSIANGSLHEAETQPLLAKRLGYVDEPTCEALLRQSAEVGRLLYGLMRRLRSSPSDPQPLTPDP